MNRTIAIFSLAAALAVAALPVQSDTGDMIARANLDQIEGAIRVTDSGILDGLPAGSGAIMIPKGTSMNVEIPQWLKDRPGHPYTLAMKIKTRISDGWVSLLNMPDNNTDAMIYLHKTTRKVCLKQFDKSSNSALVSSRGVELDRWTTLAFAFDTNATKVYLDGEEIFSGTGALAGSYADCYLSDDFLVGADDDGDDNDFYLADLRIYDGAVAVGDELPGWGDEEDPFLISSVADWNLFATNVSRGMAVGNKIPCYRLTADIGSAASPVTQTVGTDDHPFYGKFEGNSNTIHVAISSSDPGAAPFARIGKDIVSIKNLRVSGSVASSADYAAGLVGIVCNLGTNLIQDCDISVDVTVTGAGHAGGIVGHGGSNHDLALLFCTCSGAISGFTDHAGGLMGWCDALGTLQMGGCLFKGSFSPAASGKCHPIACRSSGSVFNVIFYGKTAYYLNTVTPTVDIYHRIVEGTPVSATLVPGLWDVPVAAADGNAYYMQTATSITPQTGGMRLSPDDIITGTGGPDTHLIVYDDATVTLRNVCITNITDDEAHNWAGISCLADTTIILEGDNVIKGGLAAIPGIYIAPGKTLTIRGDGTLDASSNGSAAGIGGGIRSGLACGNIVIEGGIVTATGGIGAAGIGCGMYSSCGDITIYGGTVTATGGIAAAGIGCGMASTNGNIVIIGGVVAATVTAAVTEAGTSGGAGIGGATGSVCGDVAISGGVVTAVGSECAAGIGSSAGGDVRRHRHHGR